MTSSSSDRQQSPDPGTEDGEDTSAQQEDAIPAEGYHKLPVVGIGGSAGSIGELQKFFAAMSISSGMAFVVVLHLSPDHESTLAQLLQGVTTMPVEQVLQNTTLKPDHVYVIPPGKHLSMIDGHLELSDLTPVRGRRVAIDLFFRTLADTHGPHAVAIVLSGADGDGAIGIKRIKERGGLTIAQEPTEAEHGSMPRTAIATGMVDWILPVAEIPSRLVAYSEAETRIQLPPENGPAVPNAPAEQAAADGKEESLLREVLIFVRTRLGHDFSGYKRATVVRRIGRRMQVNGLETLSDYLAFLRTEPGEVTSLLNDLLISVTNFFRDKEAFLALGDKIPELFAGKTATDTVRVWVTACATGEEAYSIAMLLAEHAETLSEPPAIQVFATDLDEAAVHAAREGFYPDTIAADVSEDRLRHFFTREQGGYRVKRALREMVLFALHNVLKDSPFSRIDLLTSRNLLIYLNRAAQQSVFDIFHFALRPNGLLFLGLSESVDEASNLFHVLDKRNRIYSRQNVPTRALPIHGGPSTLTQALSNQKKNSAALPHTGEAHQDPSKMAEAAGGAALGRENSWGDLHFRLMERYSPPSVLVNPEHSIVHLSEHAARFLQFRGGAASVNLLQVVHPMLRIELRAALFRAAQTQSNVQALNIPLEVDGSRTSMDLFVEPVADYAAGYLLVVFKQRGNESGELPERAEPEPVSHQLEQELMQTKSELRLSAEQYATSIEELKASNEELQAMNEELRSATEEMETGREELQSINEELVSVNQEAKSKLDELSRSNNDLQNLIASTAIATVFLDRALRIKRYTPHAVELFSLIPTDLGRPLSNLAHQLDYEEILDDAQRVLARLIPQEREISSHDGRWFLVRLLPYRGTEDRIEGVVLTFLDITARKKSEDVLRQREAELLKALEENVTARKEVEAAAQAKDHFLAVLSHELRTPLTPVMMNVSLLLETTELNSGAREALEIVNRNVEIEARLIDQLLDFTRMSKGKLRFDCQPVDLNDVVHQALEVAAPEMKARDQKLELSLEAKHHQASGDAIRLQQAVWNLVKNASKFSSKGGTVRIKSRNEGHNIILEVEDDGIGIPSAIIGSIFNPFDQGTFRISREFGGLGLGLAIAKAAVEGHDGSIQVKSDGLGHGATFSITLPITG